MRVIDGCECDHCHKSARDPYEDENTMWVFVGDTRNRTIIEGIRFGTIPIIIKLPRTLEFCGEKCAASWFLEAVVEKLDRQETHSHKRPS